MSQNEELRAKIRAEIADHLCCDIEKVTDEAILTTDLGADSLDMIELAMAFEDDHGIELRDAEVNACQNVADAIALVEGKLAAKATA